MIDNFIFKQVYPLPGHGSDDYAIVYDRETKVMYVMSKGRGMDNHVNFTLLVNADGTPRLWDGEQ